MFHSSKSFYSFPDKVRGGILLAVLGLIYLMAVLVTQFMETTHSQIRLRATQSARSDLRTLGYSALESALAVIHEFTLIDEGIYSPSQGWGDPMLYAESIEWPEDIQIEIAMVDESGKVPLNQINIPLLKIFFEEMDIDFGDIDMLVDSLTDWVDEDDDLLAGSGQGAEKSYYESQDPPVLPPNGPLTSYESFRYIKGFKDIFFDEETRLPNERYNKFVEATSLYNPGRVNINTASPFLKMAYARLRGFEPSIIDDFKAGLDRIPGTTDDEYFKSNEDLQRAGIEPGEEALISFEVVVFRVIVTVSRGDKQFVVNALMERQEVDGAEGENSIRYPFRILRLVENTNVD